MPTATRKREPTTTTTTRKKILVVDDEPDINLTLKVALEEYGFEVEVFDSAILTLDNFRKGLYDLAILDIKMPVMNGFELYREVKRIDPKLKVCFLTAGEMYHGNYGDILDHIQFIRKPIENTELLKRINEIMNK
jgi:DNA-binding response OmpR family regulator